MIILRVSVLTLNQSLKHGALCTLRSASRVRRPLTKLPHTRDTSGALRIPRGAPVPATEAPKVVVFVLRTGTCEHAQRVQEKDTGFCGTVLGILMTSHNEDFHALSDR